LISIEDKWIINFNIDLNIIVLSYFTKATFHNLVIFLVWMFFFIYLWISANISGSYTLQSAIQKLQGPRLFHPFFGFAYKSSQSQITVTVNTGSTTITLQPSAQISSTGWNYLSKNLTSVFYKWSQRQEFQVISLTHNLILYTYCWFIKKYRFILINISKL